MERGKLPPSGYGAVMVWIPAGARALPTSSAASCVIMPSRLFRKYVALFVAVVCLALLANDLFETWVYYRDYKASLIHIQRKQAEAAADKLGYFVKEIEGHLGRTNQMALTPSTLEERELDALGLLRQVPAISEFSQLDAYGREKLRVSRIAVDAVGSNADFSTDPKFVTAMANKVYYGPVYFRSESEPYMTLALARAFGHAGVSVAEINLKFIWNLVSQVKVGQEGRAYVVDAQGRLIAHPDMSLVLRKIDLSGLVQVQAAQAIAGAMPSDPLQVAKDIQGRRVLTTYAPIPPLGWLVFVELPVDEAYQPLYATIGRMTLLLLAALGLALLGGVFLARMVVRPIHALQAVAARMNSGDLRVGFESHEARAMRRTSSMTDAAYRKARAESTVASKSFANRRLRPIQAKNRSTTQRRG
jgi:two-component system, NtrC family, sensor kinase